jgi:hypothetical protein
MNKRREWTMEEDKILEEMMFTGKSSAIDIAKILGRSEHSVRGHYNILGLKNTFIKKTFSHDENYFAKKNLENCYYAGYLMADGSISKRNGALAFSWQTAEKDKEVLDIFKEKIKYNGDLKKIFKYNEASQTTGIHYKINIHSAKKITDDLANNFGVTEGKTYRCVPQNFDNKEQELAFLIGLFDGDGTITIMDKEKTSFCMVLCGASLPTIEWAQKLIESLNLPCLANRPRNIIKRPNEACYYFSVGGVTAAYLYETLRAINVPRLARKWDNPEILKIVDILKEKLAKSSKKEELLKIPSK